MLVSIEWGAKNLKFSFLHLGRIQNKIRIRKKKGLWTVWALFCDELPILVLVCNVYLMKLVTQ